MISIIIPMYNASEYLRRCLDSMLAQSYTEWEAILVDDGSKDNTKDICKKYEERDARIVYYYQINSGVSKARNKGLELASGDYISFLDADDYVAPDYLKKLMETIEKTKADICYCKPYNVDIYGNDVGYKSKWIYDKQIIIADPDCYDWTDPNAHFVVWGGIYRAECLKNLYFSQELSVGEDTYFFARILKNASRIAILNERLYYYSHIEGSAVRSGFSDKRYTELQAWKMICELNKGNVSCQAAYTLRILRMYRRYRKDEKMTKAYLKDLKSRLKGKAWTSIIFFAKKREIKTVVKMLILTVGVMLEY